MKYFKGFGRDMKCNGFQYKEGETYHEEKAKLCECGFHACEIPLDVLGYYPPGHGSIYREVELEDVCKDRSSDSKVCAKTIKIGAEIGICGLVKAQIEWIKNTIDFDNAIKRAKESPDKHATGEQGAASATGYQGAASATGDQGAASATGYQGAASATGYQGAASATGEQGAASATGTRGAASATGYQGAASATGTRGAASATGTRGAASATGKDSVALAAGKDGKVMGALGCAIFAVERGDWNGETYPIIAVNSAIVDGKKIKPNVFYTLKNGEFVEVQDNE